MQLQRNLAQFDAADVAVFAISNDPVDAQQAFADEFGITFALLADPDHAVIEATGILNTLIAPDEEYYGLPFPGSYVIARDGTIEEKLFFQHYRTRPSAATVLAGGFGIDFEIRDHPHDEVQGDKVTVRATLGGDGMVFGEVSVLYVDIELADDTHVYASPAPAGLVATEVLVSAPDGIEVSEATYPTSSAFRVEGIDEDVRVFDGNPVRITVPIMNGARDVEPFPVDIQVRYQACTSEECFMPQTATLRLHVPRPQLLRRR